MSPAELISLIALGVQTTLGILVLYRSPRNPENQCFSFLLFLFAFWSGTELLIMDRGLSPLLGKLLFSPMIVLPLVFAIFTAIFPRRAEHSLIYGMWYKNLFGIIPCFLLLGLLWRGELIHQLDAIPGGFSLSFGTREFWLKGIVVGYLLVALKHLQEARGKTGSDFLSRRVSYTFAGLVLPAAAGSMYVALGRYFLGGSTVYTFGVFPALSVIMSGLIAYAMLRYQLMEIDRFFAVGLVYTLLTLILAGGIELLENFLQGVFHLSGTWNTILVTLLVAALFAPLRDALGRVVDRWFGRVELDIAGSMGKALKQMRRSRSREEVMQVLLDTLGELLHCSQALMKLTDGLTVARPVGGGSYPGLPQKWPVLDEIDAVLAADREVGGGQQEVFSAWKEAGFHLVFPVRQENQPMGGLFIGPKTGLLPYTQPEKDLAGQLCEEVFPVFEAISLVEALVEREKDARELEWAENMYHRIQADASRQVFAGFPVCLFTSLAKTLKGDLIDVCDGPEKKFLAVFDAFHQGIPAALTLHISRAALRMGAEVDLPGLHWIMGEFTDPPLRTAVSLMEIRPDGSVCWSNAGNPPPLLLDGNGRVEPLTESGKPLGMEEGPAISVRDFLPVAGQGVLLATNGLAKAFGDSSGEGLRAFLREFRGDPVAELRESIGKRLQGVQDSGEFPDDITFVLVGGAHERANTPVE